MDLINSTDAWKTGKLDPDTGKPVDLLRVFVDALSGTFTPSGLNTGGGVTRVELSSLEWVRLSRTDVVSGVGTTSPKQAATYSNLSGGNNISVQNTDDLGADILISTEPTKPLPAIDFGMRVVIGGERSYAIKPGIPVWVRIDPAGGVTSGTVVYEELA